VTGVTFSRVTTQARLKLQTFEKKGKQQEKDRKKKTSSAFGLPEEVLREECIRTSKTQQHLDV